MLVHTSMRFSQPDRRRRRVKFYVTGGRSSFNTTNNKRPNSRCEMGVCFGTITHGNDLGHEGMYAGNIRTSDVWILPTKMTQSVANSGLNSTGLKQRRYINWLAIFTYVGYGVTEICYFSMCRPFSDYFAVPNPPGQGKPSSSLIIQLHTC